MPFEVDFQREIWEKKYKYKLENYEGFASRIASSLFPEDEDRRTKLYNRIVKFRTLFGGRINSNIGVDESGLTLFNCFIGAVGDNPDSLDGILSFLKEYASTLKTEGGMGFCANFIRPANTVIRKIGVTSPGSIKFLEAYDKVSEIITAGSINKGLAKQGIPTKNSIRKGATMVTMSDCHPDIEEFITAKTTPNRLTKMNMSVMLSNSFIKAVELDANWDLWFPDINCEQYEVEWSGDFASWYKKGYPRVVYKTLKARALYDLILKNSFKRNEPGIIFIDNAKQMDNLWYLDESTILGPNPCVAKGTLVTTNEGPKPIEDLVGKTVTIWDGGAWVSCDTFVQTGINKPIIRFVLGNGLDIKVTPHHTMILSDTSEVEARNLNVGNVLLNSGLTTYTDQDLTIVAIETDLFADTYCCNVLSTHEFTLDCGVVVGNCSEIFGNIGKVYYDDKRLTLGDVCCLGSLAIPRYYDMATKVFNIDAFLEDTRLMARSLDSVIDISSYPLEQYEYAAKLKRKIGVGITGIGSLMMMLNIRYGSEACIKFLEPIYSSFINTLYQESALMAKEKGPFKLYDPKLLEGGFVANSGVLTDETLDMIRTYGLRNSALAAIAPNGTLSILAGVMSGGIEPVFSKEYVRWVRIEDTVDFNYPSISKGEWFETDMFKETTIGDEKVLVSRDGNYRIDKNTGLCKKVVIEDYGYKYAKQHGLTETAGAMELTVEEHLNVLALTSKYVDQSSSKTINLPADCTYEEFRNLYQKINFLGIKGCTTYREGSMTAVLETTKVQTTTNIKKQMKDFLDSFKDQDGDTIAHEVKLPEQYPSKGYILRSEGKKWYVHVAFKDKALTKPFAVFVNTNNKEDSVSTFNSLDKLEELAIVVGLDGAKIKEVQDKYNGQSNPVKVCRMLGFLLRHNVNIYEIVKALDSVDEAIPGTFVHRIKKFLGQFVSDVSDVRMCPECNTKNLVFAEGCFMCSSCGFSKC